MKALVVEDEEGLQLIYKHILSDAGYDVRLAFDGYVAIKAIEEGLAPDLVILDMRMPNCGGLKVLEYLQTYENIDNMHVVIASATRDFETYVSMLPSCEFLLKPVLSPNLLEVVGRVHG
ncbi:MAG: hypothetical protein Phog2KO_42890 [Phototrophicaceae bacterium]